MSDTLPPSANKFHVGNAADGKHYWLTPPDLYAELNAQYAFDFDPCPYPLPEGFDGLTADWGASSYVNPPFGSIIHDGKKKGATAWVRKAIAENAKGKRVVLVYPIDKWVLMLLKAGATVENLGDVRWLATEDGLPGKGTGRHIAAFVLAPSAGNPISPAMWWGHYDLISSLRADEMIAEKAEQDPRLKMLRRQRERMLDEILEHFGALLPKERSAA